MSGMKARSNFALMDEMEEKEGLESGNVRHEEQRPAIYQGRVYEMLRRLKLSPMLAMGIVLTALCAVFPQFVFGLFGLGPVFLIFGIVEKIYLDRKDREK